MIPCGGWEGAPFDKKPCPARNARTGRVLEARGWKNQRRARCGIRAPAATWTTTTATRGIARAGQALPLRMANGVRNAGGINPPLHDATQCVARSGRQATSKSQGTQAKSLCQARRCRVPRAGIREADHPGSTEGRPQSTRSKSNGESGMIEAPFGDAPFGTAQGLRQGQSFGLRGTS